MTVVPTLRRKVTALLITACLTATFDACAADPAPASAETTAGATRLVAAARTSHWALDRLEDLTDLVGPRLSGSPGAAAAVEQVAAALRAQGLVVKLEPVRVPHWERGLESAELIDYTGHPAGLQQKVVLTALGGSGATPPEGITAPVLVVHDFAELEQLGARVRGAIILFDVPFPPGLVEHSLASAAYGQTIAFRYGGPDRAAHLGAAACLVRSLGSADFRIPHTGGTGFADGQTPIPAAAVSSEDAQLISRLSHRGGPVRMHLTLTPRSLPEADSFNVVADLPGTDPAAGIVLVSGHLDSWDLATGAIDDGAGVAAAMGAIQLIKAQDLHPRRTVRFVAWMNEENGGRGATAYGKQHAAELAAHVAAIESDAGAGHPSGLITNVPVAGGKQIETLLGALRNEGLGTLLQLVRPLGSDLEPLEEAGTPVFEPLVDNRHYFDLHHTPADTFDKIDPADFNGQVGMMAALAWYLADSPEAPPRLPAKAH